MSQLVAGAKCWLRGRFFDARDVDAAPNVIIVDERLAQKFWPGQDPLGRYMYFPGDVSSDIMKPPKREDWLTVVGVVGNVRLDGLVDGPGFRTVGAYYLPLDQTSSRTMTLAVRSAQEPTSASRVSLGSSRSGMSRSTKGMVRSSATIFSNTWRELAST